MQPRIYWLTVVMLCLKAPSTDSYEYCHPKHEICEKSKPHIVCVPEQITPIGKLVGVAPTTGKLQRVLLDAHNTYRNKTACGETKDSLGNYYAQATRMRTLIWDHELAYLANIHVRRCEMIEDECHNTARFPNSGQNIARVRASYHIKLIDDVPKRIEEWYRESQKAVKGDTHSFAESGKFALMVNDRVSRVGCAISLCFEDNKEDLYEYHYHYTCNYEYNNVVGEAPYTVGPRASQCQQWDDAGVSDKYVCLCENSGKIYPK